jgi:hypothetical protein
VVILSPRICGTDADACDGLVYRTALSLQTYFADHANGVRPPHIVAQVSRPIDPVAREALGLDEVVASHEMGGRLLAQTVTSPGITHFFDEILSSEDDSNEVYSCPMPQELCIGQAQFWRVIEYYARRYRKGYPVLPVGLRVTARSGEYATASNGHASAATLLNPTVSELEKFGVRTFERQDQVLFLADEPVAADSLVLEGEA